LSKKISLGRRAQTGWAGQFRPGMAGMARAMGATLTGAQKCLAKIQFFTYSFSNLYLAPHKTINHKAASTQRPYLMDCVGPAAPVPSTTVL